ncbi:uncharacterized protein [Cicer arietinum]|uniref:uncharacterized protein isoform X2 n=1 Tax=Cicer arietinum TaxID=3827 RepID=UPI003CC65D25
MAIEPQHVMVMQDASKLNLKVFSWVVNGLSLKPTDMVTLFAILHEVYNPLGYKSKLDNKALAGVNQRIIEEELARKKEEFLNHEDLAKIAKLYDSNEVVFKVQLFAGSSPKNVAIENAIKLKATWMILDRQMKKDEELFLQKLSCGVSRVVGKTHIVRLRGPLDVAVEIQCNSHESYAESLPESTCGCGDVSNIGFVPKRERCRALTWSERVRVVIGLSRGLKYLHDNNIIHGNIKPSNILLTHDFNPLLGDFDLGKNLEPKNSLNNKSIGNSEYIAPEYEDKGKVSSKTDVYSFGVVILELITGRKAADKISGDKKLVAWAKPLLRGKKYSELVDPIISNTYEEEQLRWLVKVAAQCLKKKPKERFSMNMAVSALQGIADGEQCHITEDLTSDILQSIPNRKECYMKGDFPPVVSVISDSQGSKDNVGLKETDHQSPKEERTESVSFEKETIKVENNHFYMIDQQNSDILRQINEHVIGHDQEEEKSFAQVKRGLIPAPICGMIVQTNLINDKTQRQSSFYENLHDEHQDKIILVNPKSSACSICKSKRPKVVRMKDFTYDELLEATQGFSAENSLSEKEDGPTFKGMLESKVKIVVKKYQIARSQEEKIFKSEVQLFTNVKHKNVVMLLGLCTDKSQLMIVYEHVCNGSLDHYLSKGNFQSLTWMERVKVSVGTARGLKYLHGNNIIHGSIKASNILLTHDFEPLIGDFGLGKVKLEPMKSYKDKSARDFGYTAPEYLENGKLSTKTDVYSFGVVLLELITGRRATDKLPGGKSLVGWARPLLGGKKYHQLMDPKISNSCEEEQLLWLVQVTEKCLKKNPKERYTMNMVVSALQGIAESDECCVVEEESPKNSYSPNDELSMPKTSSQGEMMAELVPREQEQIDRNRYKAEISFRTSITSNDMIDQINPDQQIEENHQHYKETIHLEKNGIFLNQNQGKTILENLKSSVCSICKSRRPNNRSQRKFTWEELEDATEGFSIKYSLSEGEYGPAFRGQLDNKVKIAIKKIQVTSLQEEKMFMTEVQLLANARHENMIMLLGSCIRENQLLVVYEYACNGSLDQYLSRKNGRSLNWRERVKIAIGLSRGLKYLHENNIIHGRVKPSNILLNHDFKPLVGDFMFRKERSELKNSHEDKCVRNCGYTAPECWDCGKLSTKGDVYSFGVILLELIAGCLISDQIPGHKCLVEWARPLLGGRKYLQLVDPKISSSYDEEELASLVLVTEKCLRKNPKERFTMNMVVSVMPFVVDSNEIYVIEDSSSSEKSNEECRDSYVASSKVEEELQDENKLGTKIGEEREDNIACSRKNSETESTSPMVFQDGGSCESYGGARDFFLQGAQEYIACEIFFSLCNSI